MTYYNPKIPEKNGEFLCIPSLNLISQLIKSNKEKFKAYDFTIGDEGFYEFRKRLREKNIKYNIHINHPPPPPPLPPPPPPPPQGRGGGEGGGFKGGNRWGV